MKKNSTVRNHQCDKKDCQFKEKWISKCECGHEYNSWLLENHSLMHSNCQIETKF